MMRITILFGGATPFLVSPRIRRLVSATTINLTAPKIVKMGRSKNQKRKHQQQQQAKNNGGKSKNKRRKNMQQFWILDCQATKVSGDNEGDSGSIGDIELLVTRVELTDDHQKANLQSRATGNDKSLAKKDQTENTEENAERATGGDHDEAAIPILTLIPPTGDISGSVSACNTTTDPEGETEDKGGLSIKVSIRKANSAKRPIEKVQFDLRSDLALSVITRSFSSPFLRFSSAVTMSTISSHVQMATVATAS